MNKTITASFENFPTNRAIAGLIYGLDYVIKWTRLTDGKETVE